MRGREDPHPSLGRGASALLFSAALLVRLGAIALAGFSTLRFGDARAYLYAASELAHAGHYPRLTEPFCFRAPGYPAFLVGVTLGHPESIPAAKIANAVLGSLAVLLLAALAARLFRRRSLALAVGLAGALHPGFVLLSTEVQSEPLFLLLLLAAGYLLLAAADRPSSNLALFAGAALAAAALTRPSALLLSPLLAATLFDRRYPTRARVHLAASALAGFSLALFPWTLRNALVYHEFIPVNDAAGSVFYQGNSDWMPRFYQLRNLREYRDWSTAMFEDLERKTRAIDAVSGGSPAAKTSSLVRSAIEQRRRDLAGWAGLLLRKSWDWMRPYASPLFWPAWVVWTTGLYYAGAILLAAVGWTTAPRPGVRLFVLFYLALTMAVHVVFFVLWRYRVPYWDPVLLLYGCYGGDKIVSRWLLRKP